MIEIFSTLNSMDTDRRALHQIFELIDCIINSSDTMGKELNKFHHWENEVLKNNNFCRFALYIDTKQSGKIKFDSDPIPNHTNKEIANSDRSCCWSSKLIRNLYSFVTKSDHHWVSLYDLAKHTLHQLSNKNRQWSPCFCISHAKLHFDNCLIDGIIKISQLLSVCVHFVYIWGILDCNENDLVFSFISHAFKCDRYIGLRFIITLHINEGMINIHCPIATS